MKPLTCEMCGSNNIIKQDGLFVCQHCGTKYSVEEARKMMIEGTVTVKIDTSDELEKLYQLARRAKDVNDIENAAKYYSMILIKDPRSWEATFYAVYYKIMGDRSVDVYTAYSSVINSIETAFKLIKENIVDKNEQIKVIEEIRLKCIYLPPFLFEIAKNRYNSNKNTESQNSAVREMIYASMLMYTLGNKIFNEFNNYPECCQSAAYSWKSGVGYHKMAIPFMTSKEQKEGNKETIMLYVSRIQEFDPSYEAPNVETGGCYIATAVYGSYDCPEVWTLRRYRDNTLARSWRGRMLIQLYYALSPTLVRRFGNTRWFKEIWKGKLDYMVSVLNGKGVENTPYKDKNW